MLPDTPPRRFPLLAMCSTAVDTELPPSLRKSQVLLQTNGILKSQSLSVHTPPASTSFTPHGEMNWPPGCRSPPLQTCPNPNPNPNPPLHRACSRALLKSFKNSEAALCVRAAIPLALLFRVMVKTLAVGTYCKHLGWCKSRSFLLLLPLKEHATFTIHGRGKL
jgi:hypothetical protein